ncbi:MAG: hypothetical protein SFW36_17835 [Leptolyngbyaceae cyanobacterium bins.59]|nr:hypothetical protein [Leptolyngbyaceae cyanobacterium bins.59]
MKRKLLNAFVVLGTLVVGVGTLPLPDAQPIGVAQSANQFQAFVLPYDFSILYPPGWFVNEGASRDAVVITSYRPGLRGVGRPTAAELARAVKTDVMIKPGSFGTVVNQALLSSRLGGSKLIKQGRLTIDGRPALRMWSTFKDDPFPNAITTIIRYSPQETAVITSYYNAKNIKAVALIRNIHWSFRVRQ